MDVLRENESDHLCAHQDLSAIHYKEKNNAGVLQIRIVPSRSHCKIQKSQVQPCVINSPHAHCNRLGQQIQDCSAALRRSFLLDDCHINDALVVSVATRDTKIKSSTLDYC